MILGKLIQILSLAGLLALVSAHAHAIEPTNEKDSCSSQKYLATLNDAQLFRMDANGVYEMSKGQNYRISYGKCIFSMISQDPQAPTIARGSSITALADDAFLSNAYFSSNGADAEKMDGTTKIETAMNYIREALRNCGCSEI
jgi:hypothetical protein